LNPGERHQLGAHYTPRAYVERLVLPTVIEPLRADWENVRAAALTQARAGDLKKARAEVNDFHERLCQVTVLDPACGSGNFLYVALQHLKVLEGEVFDVAAQFGDTFRLELERQTVDPHQFLGLEINPRAASIAELVLWIGYLQWHFRLHGKRTPPEPILRAFKNIQCRDAVLEYDGEAQPALDDAGKPKSVWDRKSTKADLVTGREVPDETKRVPLLTYANPRPAQWPRADFIVGNPPFIGTARMREDLGDGYAETLRATYPAVPESADFVLYWWHKAAELTRAGRAKRFGLITTNSLRQTFARRVVQTQMSATPPLSLLFAIPDHPWVDTAEGAAVRIAMTVGAAGEHPGELLQVTGEEPQPDGSETISFTSLHGKISADLTLGADVASVIPLAANEGLVSRGVQTISEGFVLPKEKAEEWIAADKKCRRFLRPFLNGKDLTSSPREVWVIDFFGVSQDESLKLSPTLYQHLLVNVKPERDQSQRASYRKNWWILGEPQPMLRRMIAGLARYIVSPVTAKHRFFLFLQDKILPDQALNVFAFDDAFFLGVLSSRIHVVFSLAAGGRLGVGNDPRYNNSRCFDPFPFPLCSEAEKKPIRKLAEELDAHRKRVQAQHGLTLTGLYNVLEKLRAGEKLTDKEKLIHDAGLVSVLKQLHDDLDAAVFAAYAWPATLTDAEILERLVALNAERAVEEKRGVIHWLRPDYQARNQKPTTSQKEMDLPAGKAKLKTRKQASTDRKSPWPKKMAERVQAVEAALHRIGTATPAELAGQFKRAQPADVAEILETLVTMGRARQQGEKFSR